MEQIRKPVAGEQYLEAFAVLRATKNWTWWLLLVCIVLSVAAFLLVRWTKLLDESPSFQAAKQSAQVSAGEVPASPARRDARSGRVVEVILASDAGTQERRSVDGLSGEELEKDAELARMAAEQSKEDAEGEPVDQPSEPATPQADPETVVPDSPDPMLPEDVQEESALGAPAEAMPEQKPSSPKTPANNKAVEKGGEKQVPPSTQPGSDDKLNRSEIIYRALGTLLPMIKAVALIAAILLTLSLMLALMVVCAGRLGGAGQLASALIWSALLLLMLVPWDAVFGTDFIPGVLVGREELVAQAAQITWGAEASWQEHLVYYLRFIGWPALAVLVWILVQLKFDRGCRQVFLGAEPTRD